MNAEAIRALDTVRLAAASGAQRLAFTGVDHDTRIMLTFATTLGAPLTLAADLAHRRLTDHGDVARAVSVASAEARSVAVFLLLAPVLLLPVTARMLDVAVGAFYQSTPGRVVFSVAAGFYLTGFWLIRQFIRALTRPVTHAGNPLRWWVYGATVIAFLLGGARLGLITFGLLLWRASVARTPQTSLSHVAFCADMLVIGVAAGLTVPQALRHTAEQLPDVAVPLRQIAYGLDVGVVPTPVDGAFGQLADLAWQSHHDGAPAVLVLTQFAMQMRADERAELLARTARLPARLTIPTTVLFLPATVLVMLAPVVAHGFTVLR